MRYKSTFKVSFNVLILLMRESIRNEGGCVVRG